MKIQVSIEGTLLWLVIGSIVVDVVVQSLLFVVFVYHALGGSP